MKRSVLLIVYTLVMFLANTSILIAREPINSIEVPVKDITIKVSSHFKTKKAPVGFSHSTHLPYSCIDCHHNWDRVSPIQGCMTSGCHETLMPSPPTAKPSKDKKVLSITGAYHRACRGCHREQLTEKERKDPSEAAAPVKCDGCHVDKIAENEYSIESFTLPLGDMIISAPEDADTKRQAVNFPHGRHFDQECQTCHHDWDGDSEIEGCMTADCHDQALPDESTGDINDPVNVQYYLTAYHKVCYQCHTDLKRQEKLLAKINMEAGMPAPAESKAPVKCGGCHNVEN